MSPEIEDLVKRLFKYRSIDPITGCWNWTGSKNSKGYGWIGFRGEVYKVHRVMGFLVYNLDLNDGSSNNLMLHKCDNPSCFNPSHLKIGTQGINKAEQGVRHPRLECKRGHGPEFYETIYRPGKTCRVCTICDKENRSQAKAERDRKRQKLLTTTTNNVR